MRRRGERALGHGTLDAALHEAGAFGPSQKTRGFSDRPAISALARPGSPAQHDCAIDLNFSCLLRFASADSDRALMSGGWQTAITGFCLPRTRKNPRHRSAGGRKSLTDLEDYGMKLRWTRNTADQTPA